MQEFSERYDVVITKADGGGAVVIIDGKDYLNETIEKQNNCNKLEDGPTDIK